MQISRGLTLLNNMVESTNNEQLNKFSSDSISIDFEKLITSGLEQNDIKLEGKSIGDNKELDINEEELSKIVSLLNQIINTVEINNDNSKSDNPENQNIKLDISSNTKDSLSEIIGNNKELNILSDIASDDLKKINIRVNENLIPKNTNLDNLIDKLIVQYESKEQVSINSTVKDALDKLSKVLTYQGDNHLSVNNSLDNEINTKNNENLVSKNTNLNNLIDKVIKHYENKEIADVNNILKDITSELSKISSSYSINKDSSLDDIVNNKFINNDILIPNAITLSISTNNKEASNNELEILDSIANNDDLRNLNFNNLDSKTNNTIKQTHSIEQTPYKTIEQGVVQDTIKNIEYMKTNNIQELNVILKPKELGEMNIKLLQEHDGMKAILTVHSKEVFDIVNKNISDIKVHLENINVNVKDVVVNVQTDNTYSNENFERNFSNNQNNREQQNKNNNNNRSLDIDDENIKEVTKEDNINLLA